MGGRWSELAKGGGKSKWREMVGPTPHCDAHVTIRDLSPSGLAELREEKRKLKLEKKLAQKKRKSSRLQEGGE